MCGSEGASEMATPERVGGGHGIAPSQSLVADGDVLSGLGSPCACHTLFISTTKCVHCLVGRGRGRRRRVNARRRGRRRSRARSRGPPSEQAPGEGVSPNRHLDFGFGPRYGRRRGSDGRFLRYGTLLFAGFALDLFLRPLDFGKRILEELLDAARSPLFFQVAIVLGPLFFARERVVGECDLAKDELDARFVRTEVLPEVAIGVKLGCQIIIGTL